MLFNTLYFILKCPLRVLLMINSYGFLFFLFTIDHSGQFALVDLIRNARFLRCFCLLGVQYPFLSTHLAELCAQSDGHYKPAVIRYAKIRTTITSRRIVATKL